MDSQRPVIRITRRFNAPPERVFDAWLDPKTASQFLFTRPGQTVVRAEVDARVGGSYLFVARRGSEDIDHLGKYLEIERPRRLVFTLRVPAIRSESRFWTDDNRVTIEIVPAEKGCELTLTHEVTMPELEDRLREGWTGFLERLDALV